MIRTLHLIETIEPGGAETVLVELASRLGKQFLSLGGVFDKGWVSEALELRGIPVLYMPLKRRFDLGWAKRLAKIIAERKIDLLHSHEFTMNCYATLAANKARVPIVCTVHGQNYYGDHYYRRAAYRWASRNASVFVAVSEALRQSLCERVGIKRDRVITIRNGIDVERFAAATAKRAVIRQSLGIQEEAIVAITVAALFPVKGHVELLKVAEAIATRANIVFMFVGEGPMETELRQAATQLTVGHIVKFMGFRSDVSELLVASDLFILPSYSEGLPVSVLEAMASGLPIVATRVGGIPELIEDGVHGFLVPCRDSEALMAAINDLATNRQMREQMGASGRTRVRSEFGLMRMIGEYESLYNKLLRQADVSLGASTS